MPTSSLDAATDRGRCPGVEHVLGDLVVVRVLRRVPGLASVFDRPLRCGRLAGPLAAASDDHLGRRGFDGPDFVALGLDDRDHRAGVHSGPAVENEDVRKGRHRGHADFGTGHDDGCAFLGFAAEFAGHERGAAERVSEPVCGDKALGPLHEKRRGRVVGLRCRVRRGEGRVGDVAVVGFGDGGDVGAHVCSCPSFRWLVRGTGRYGSSPGDSTRRAGSP